MGPHQYNDHAGMRDGRSMSGARLWAEAEAQREIEHLNGTPNKLGAELMLVDTVAASIDHHVPFGTKVIELGPGTLRSFRKKTIPLLRALQTRSCIIVDKSAAFLKDIKVSEQALGLEITPLDDDFFIGDHSFQQDDRPALVCAFGGVISNLVAPVSLLEPMELLSGTLKNFANAIHRGWLLVAFDSTDDSKDVSAYYAKHALFQLNIFDRMAVELPITGDFDPAAFAYVAKWLPESRQLAHLAVLQRDLNFAIGQQSFALKQGQNFHLKNSFKFSEAFFEQCVQRAGLSVIKRWICADSRFYLLGKNIS